MRVFVVLSMVLAAAFAVPNHYGNYEQKKVEKTEIRIESPKYEAPVREAYETPKYSAYEAPVVRASYQAPVIKTSYTAPPPPPPVVKSTYEAPVIKSSYMAPEVKTSYQSYTPAPPPVIKTSYEAPKVESYSAPAAYAAPSYGAYGETLATKEAVRPHIPILSFNHHDDNKGTYKLDVKTGHGITHVEHGTPKDLNLKEGPVNIKAGSYSYTGPDGKVYSVNWTADEHGFRATGEHLPTPPPIPADIQKSLELPRIREFQPEFEHEHRDHESHRMESHAPLSMDTKSYGSSYSSYASPSLPVRVAQPSLPVRY